MAGKNALLNRLESHSSSSFPSHFFKLDIRYYCANKLLSAFIKTDLGRIEKAQSGTSNNIDCFTNAQ